VIGGLLGATIATLVVLPALFAMLQSRQPRYSPSLHPDDDASPERLAHAGGPARPDFPHSEPSR
jgi:hypothetical protein